MHCKKRVHDLSFVTKQAPFTFFFLLCADGGGSCESLPGGVSWARQNLVVVDEAAAGQVTWRWTEVSHQRKKARWAATELISPYSAALSKFKPRVVSWQGTRSPWSAGQFRLIFLNLFIQFYFLTFRRTTDLIWFDFRLHSYTTDSNSIHRGGEKKNLSLRLRHLILYTWE